MEKNYKLRKEIKQVILGAENAFGLILQQEKGQKPVILGVKIQSDF